LCSFLPLKPKTEAIGTANACTNARRTAGSVGRGCWRLHLLPISANSYVLQQCARNDRHKRMVVKAVPGATLKLPEARLFFQLMMRLLAGPTSLDCSDQRLEGRVFGVIR